jgi:hypothetical protein
MNTPDLLAVLHAQSGSIRTPTILLHFHREFQSSKTGAIKSAGLARMKPPSTPISVQCSTSRDFAITLERTSEVFVGNIFLQFEYLPLPDIYLLTFGKKFRCDPDRLVLLSATSLLRNRNRGP